MIKIHLILSFFIFLISYDLQSSEIELIPLVIESKLDEYDGLIDHVYLRPYKSRESPGLVIDYDAFIRYQGEELLNDTAYLFAFQIQNKTSEDLDLALFLGNIDFFDFYEVTDGRMHDAIKGGSLRPNWDLTFPNEEENTVPLKVEGESVSTFIIKVEHGEFFSFNPMFELYSQKKYNSIRNEDNRNFWQGIFHGVLWVMIIYNLFFAMIGKDRTYLYYALYMIAISSYFMNISGYLTKFLYPNHPEYGTYVWLMMQTAAIFYIIFIRKFLDLKKIQPKWDLISKYLLVAVIIFVIFKASYYLIYKQYGILNYLSQFVLFMGAILTGGLILALIRSGNRLAKYFTIGSISLGLGLLIASIIAFTGHAYSRSFFNSIQIGIIFEILFFSIGLSYKMRQTEREKRLAQEQLVKQLKKNEKLQLNYQRELEQKVMERTQQIEEQKEVLEMQKYQLEEINEEKNHLISIVAHDLRNPLTSALSMSQLLKEESQEDEVKQMSEVITNSLNRMNEMIEKILDIKAVESQVIKIDRERFNMVPEVEALVEQFSGRAMQKDIELVSDLDSAIVLLDRNYFRQIVENLVSNAIKFSPKKRKVFISTFQMNGSAFFEVRDEGPGLTEEDRKRIFGKFQKLSARPTGGESSTGIGLSIVKKYVEAMDGLISFESVVNEGTTFRLEFSSDISEKK